MKKLFLLLFVFAGLSAFAQPANDDCTTAQAIGTLAPFAPCPGAGQGAQTNVAGTLVGATPANPYIFMNGCSGAGGPNMGVPANDVWYTFVASGYQAVITVNSTFANPNIAMYSGTCGALGGGVGGCAVGNGGTVTLTVEQLVPGNTYYLQVSGNTGQTGTFNMTLQNNKDCADCLNASTMTVNPLPTNGMYPPGTTVNFCYHVGQYTQVNTNWLHGVQLQFGSGWNLASLTTTPPPPCQVGGYWAYYPGGCTGTATGVPFGPGFYFETIAGQNTPGDNFGDNCAGVQPGGTWNFCFSITTNAACTPGSILSVSVNTSGDGESGSWNNAGCFDDPATVFNAVGSCCPPTMAMTPVSCIGNDGTATATPVGVSGPYNYAWTGPAGYTSNSNGVAGANTITNLVAGVYVVTITNALNCAVSNTITVTGAAVLPPAPTTTPVTYCLNDPAVPLIATPAAGGTLNWYGTNAVGGVASGTAPTPSTAAAGTTTYYVSQTIGGCEGPRAPLVVTVNPLPPAPTTAPISYCQNAAAVALTATPAAGGTLNWYGTNAVGGVASGTAPTPSTAVAGTTTYYVSQTVNGCEGPRAPLVVTVGPLPAAPATTPVTYCQNDPAVPLIATATGGATLNWYGTNAVGGVASGTAPTPSTAAAGTTTYYVSQSFGTCESPRSPLVVTVNATPAAPGTTPVTYCQNATAVALIGTPVAGATLNWYGTNAVGGVASGIAPIPSTTTPGSTTYYVSQTLLGCEGPRAPLVVTINATPPAPAAANISYCENQAAAQLSATPAAGGTLNWYGTNAVGGVASAIAPTPLTTPAGTTVYYVSQTVNGCEGPRTPINGVVNPLPLAPTIAPITYCQNDVPVALTATPSAGGTLNWYGTNAVGGVASAVAPTPSTAVPGTTTYYVSQSFGTCEGPRAPIVVTVNPTPPAPVVTTPVVYCQNDVAIALIATPIAGATLNWWGTSAVGGVSSAIATIPTTTAAGVTNYYVSQVILGCEGPRVPIVVTINATPPAPITAPVVYCENDPAVALTAVALGGATVTWWGLNAIGGAPSATAPTPLTSPAGILNYYVSQTINGCEGPRAPLQVTVKPMPAAPLSNNVTYCENTTAVALTANAGVGGSLNWYGTNAVGGVASPVAPTPATTPPGTVIYYVSQTINGCEGPRSPLNVVVNPLPVVSLNPVTPKCAPLCSSFELTGGTNVVNTNWSMGNGNVNGNDTLANYCYLNPGVFDITVTVTDNLGCKNTILFAQWVSVYEVPVADFTFTPSPVNILEPQVQFYDNSIGYTINSYNWNFGVTPPVTSAAINPGHVFTDIGSWVTTLIVTTSNGCADTISKTVIVEEDFTLYVPNAFSPNGDGVNDNFFPKGTNIDENEFQFWIFDRWGMNIYYSEEWGGKWDGRVQGHDGIVQQDVYVWKIKAKSIKGEKRNLVGHVTVVR